MQLIGIKEARMIKVLFITHENDLHGSGRSMLSLISRLKDRVSPYLLTTDADGGVVEEAEKLGVKVLQRQYYRWVYTKNGDEEWEHWKQRWCSFHDKKNDEIAHELADFVLKEKIDIVHTNVSVVDIGARINKICGVKHIWHFREFADLAFNMYPLVSECVYENVINMYSDRCIFVSKAVMNHYGFIAPAKKTLIYNGLEDEGIAQKRNNLELHLLIAGVVGETKGQMMAAKACNELIEEGYNIRLHVAGKCSKNKEEELLKTCSTGITLHGFVKDMKQLRDNIDVQLMCSRYEAFGRITVEAMLAEIPVIGSNSGGTPEIIPNEDAGGVLFTAGDYKDLKEKIKYLYNSPEKRIAIGKKGRKRALELFSVENYVSRVYDTYLEVLGMPTEKA